MIRANMNAMLSFINSGTADGRAFASTREGSHTEYGVVCYVPMMVSSSTESKPG